MFFCGSLQTAVQSAENGLFTFSQFQISNIVRAEFVLSAQAQQFFLINGACFKIGFQADGGKRRYKLPDFIVIMYDQCLDPTRLRLLVLEPDFIEPILALDIAPVALMARSPISLVESNECVFFCPAKLSFQCRICAEIS